MKGKNSSYLLLHFVILIFGITGILGKHITIGAEQLVFHRTLIATVAVLLFMLIARRPLKIRSQRLWQLLGTGVVVAIHWVTFFAAIKVSNVSVTMVCLSSTPLFTALLQPLVTKQKLILYEILLGVVVIAGIFLIVSFESHYLLGIVLALISAVMAALFTVLNAKFLDESSPAAISLYELLGAAFTVTLYLLFTGSLNSDLFVLSTSDLTALLVLGIVCTAFAFMASIWVMRQLSPFTVSLSVNMEPVYTILIAYFLWRESETMTVGFYVGSALIVGTLFVNAWLKYRTKRKEMKLRANVAG